MGIDIEGGMIVGEDVNKINIPDEYESAYHWYEESGLNKFSPWYDAEIESCVVGFSIGDIPVSEIDEHWVKRIKSLAKRFEEITGVPARLIGMQDVW